MPATIRNRVIRLPDNFSTDQILSFDHYQTGAAVEPRLPGSQGNGRESLSKGQGSGIIVAGINFGNGDDPRRAVDTLLNRGISCVVAAGFNRSFFRAAINCGLPVISTDATSEILEGDEISVDLGKGLIISGDTQIDFPPFPDFILDMLDSGGLEAYVKKEISR
jgi:3-isopropylmalate dehydratase small subunit